MTVEKPPADVSLLRWGVWWTLLGAALVVFYGVATPMWMALRAAAWAAEWRARWRRR